MARSYRLYLHPAFAQGYGVVRSGFGSVDMELRRSKRRCHCELLCVQICVDGWVGIYAWIRIYSWVRLDAWLGILANSNAPTFKPIWSRILRRFLNTDRLLRAI